MISRAKTLQVAFNGSAWTLEITVREGEPMAQVALYWRDKTEPSHEGEALVSEIAELVET